MVLVKVKEYFYAIELYNQLCYFYKMIKYQHRTVNKNSSDDNGIF